MEYWQLCAHVLGRYLFSVGLYRSVACWVSDTVSGTYFFCTFLFSPNFTNIKEPVTGTFGFMFMITHSIELKPILIPDLSNK